MFQGCFRDTPGHRSRLAVPTLDKPKPLCGSETVIQSLTSRQLVAPRDTRSVSSHACGPPSSACILASACNGCAQLTRRVSFTASPPTIPKGTATPHPVVDPQPPPRYVRRPSWNPRTRRPHSVEAERTYTTRGALGTHASHALQGIARGERRLDVANQHTWQFTLSETLEIIIPFDTKRIFPGYLEGTLIESKLNV